MGLVLDLNYQSGRRGTHMIYTIPLKFLFQITKSNCYETRSKRENRKRRTQGGDFLGGWSPPKNGGFDCVPIGD